VEQEPDKQVEEMEREAARMEKEGERLDDRIDETGKDWKAKEDDGAVPGAQSSDEEGS